MIRLLVADDHSLVRRGLRKLFSHDSDIVVAGETDSAEDVVRLLSEKPYDAVVLDISFQNGKTGLDVLKDVKQNYPKLPVIMLSVHPAEQFASTSIKAGAAGYVSKVRATEELIDVIRKVVAA